MMAICQHLFLVSSLHFNYRMFFIMNGWLSNTYILSNSIPSASNAFPDGYNITITMPEINIS